MLRVKTRRAELLVSGLLEKKKKEKEKSGLLGFFPPLKITKSKDLSGLKSSTSLPHVHLLTRCSEHSPFSPGGRRTRRDPPADTCFRQYYCCPSWKSGSLTTVETPLPQPPPQHAAGIQIVAQLYKHKNQGSPRMRCSHFKGVFYAVLSRLRSARGTFFNM